MTITFQGIGVTSARSVAIGPAHVTGRGIQAVTQVTIETHEVADELDRLNQAVANARRSLHAVRSQIPPSTPPHIAEFIDAHLLMLDDVALVDEVRKLIRDQRCNAEWALLTQRDVLVQVFDEMDDPYLRTRRDDVEHVVHQIHAFLQGEAPDPTGSDGELSGAVVVAQDLMPADLIVLKHRGASAFVTEHGGPLSHTAILARSLGVPAVVGVHNITRYLRPGETLVVDGDAGTVYAEPDEITLAHFRERLGAIERRRLALRGLVDRPTFTRDGTPIGLLANLELPEDAHAARSNGATGVGLYRTEFLYMNRDELPDEEEHLATYADIVRIMDGLPVTIRTLDLGVDKRFEWGGELRTGVCNPALGLRAIRLCLKEPELFLPQLRAILRASALGPVRLMLPLITNVQEVEAVLTTIARLKGELAREGHAFDPALPIGAMIEVPAAALDAAAIARRVDFLSIGTNDLVQYTLAIDRLDDGVSYLFDPTHPAILRLLRMTIEAGRRRGIPVSMCGEMAGDPHFTRLLLGMGLDELSMQPDGLLAIKEIVLDADVQALRRATDAVLARLDDMAPEELATALGALGKDSEVGRK